MNKKKSHIKEPKLPNSPIQEVVSAEEPKKRKKKKSASDKEHYVNGREFEDAIKAYYSSDKITAYLGDSVRKIAVGLSFAPNFINYSFKDDMVGDAVLKMYQALKHKKFKIDPERIENVLPFSKEVFFTIDCVRVACDREDWDRVQKEILENTK